MRKLQYGYGPPRSSQIVYVTITDDSYAKFGTRLLDRMEMARVNEALAQLGPAAVAYDLIFPLPMTPAADQRFADSIKQLGAVYLPIAPTDPNRTAFSVGQWTRIRALAIRATPSTP